MSAIQAANTRSTRGASKQRRDQINVEIQKLRDLLPLSDSIKDRLFQLQVMSLACIYIRKQRYSSHILQSSGTTPGPSSDPPSLRQLDGCKALRGFLLMFTKNGKMLHISENASEYLGHSVEEIMCQGDSIYDLVDSRDHSAVQSELLSGPPSLAVPGAFPDERAFICRMNLSRTAKRQLQYHKFVLVEGRYLHPAEYYQAYLSVPSAPGIQPVFAAYCQPLINPENAEVLAAGNTCVFRSLHLMDMKFLHLDDIGAHHLGYRSEDLEGDSWYRYLHPSHLQEVAYKHRLLCQEKEGSVICLIRLQSNTGAWLWLHTVLSVRGNFLHQPQDGRRVRHLIYATYQLVSDMEAHTLQANSWIYTVRQTLVSMPPKCDDSMCLYPSAQLSPLPHSVPNLMSPFITIKNEPFFVDSEDQERCSKTIRVEIPEKQTAAQGFPTSAFLSPEQSSPDSGKSLTTGPTRLLGLDEATEMCLGVAMRGPLPELRDDLDDFFRAVECHSFHQPADLTSRLSSNCQEAEAPFKPPSSLPVGAMICAPLQAECKTPEIVRILNAQTIKPAIFDSLSDRAQSRVMANVKSEWIG